ncbi:cytochrome P450 [Paenarthrobacter aurescens]|uniref:cytochrome P450 n=1 Tax=Paenarthrobacter aurescens TaxID=43663 RepID=UPI0021BE16A3|nr:cytochrome P450 [Paenarthrobacter aurescens]MCT9868632.1 cytochrome P450 [Paenarthrobacter aurescens]
MSAAIASDVGLPGSGTCPYLVVRNPDTVRDVLHRPMEFSPANALLAVTPLTGQALRILQKARFALPPVLASNDTETHAGIRKVVAGFFTPAKVAAMEPRIRGLARESATAAGRLLAAEGSVDLVGAVAADPPAIVMLEMLGLPVRDLPALKAWSLDSLELFWGWPDAGRQLELARSAADFYRWLREMVLESVAAPETNLFNALARHGLSTPQICSLGYFLLIAGQETTTQLISTTLFRLAEGSRGISWTEAASAPKARDLVRHILATESSVPTWRRVASQDTVLDGHLVPAGGEVLLELTGNHGFPWADTAGAETSGNDRPGPTPYGLAFGSGIHRCLGAKLAELEAAVVVHETAAALKGVRLRDSNPEWIRLLSFQAPRTVTLEFLYS